MLRLVTTTLFWVAACGEVADPTSPPPDPPGVFATKGEDGQWVCPSSMKVGEAKADGSRPLCLPASGDEPDADVPDQGDASPLPPDGGECPNFDGLECEAAGGCTFRTLQNKVGQDGCPLYDCVSGRQLPGQGAYPDGVSVDQETADQCNLSDQ